MSKTWQVKSALLIAVGAFVAVSLNVAQAQTDFASTVSSKKPLAYYRLDATNGKSVVGVSTYKEEGGVTVNSPGAPTVAGSKAASFDGKSGKIVTTQKGGIQTAATLMAWVNLAELPSKANRIFYVMGESQSGNDLDLQIEPDDTLRFFTSGGGNVFFKPQGTTLVNQWHMIVTTLDTTTKKRVIYWDGKQAAADMGGGSPNKTSVLSIGDSLVFSGRFFHGGIAEVALWNRALSAKDVEEIYASSNGASQHASGGGNAQSASTNTPTTGPFATTAKVEIEDSKGPIQLKREEEIAYMFMSAIDEIERNCMLTFQHVCPLNQILTGAYPKGSNIERLKFDPNKVDPNYTYTLAGNGMAWEAHANPKKPGLAGFCFMARNIGTTTATINKNGNAGWTDDELMSRGVSGDSFATQ